MDNTLGFFLSLFGGGLTAAILTFLFDRGRQQQELAIKLAEDYLNRYQELADAKGILDRNRAWTTDEENIVRRVGDWFEIMAFLCNEKLASPGIVKRIGLEGMIVDFYRDVQKTTGRGVANWWPNLAWYYKEHGG